MLLLLCALLSMYMLLGIDLLSFTLKRAGWRRFASTFLLFYAQIISTIFILGLFSLLYNFSLALLNLLLTSGLIFLVARRYGSDIFPKYFLHLRRSLKSFFKDLRHDRFTAVASLLLLGFLFWIMFLGTIFPVTDWDGNGYHLTVAGNFIQTHSIYDVPSNLPWIAGYPKGGEFIQAWSILIAHNDMVAELSQVPFLFLAIYALYSICMRLGASKRNARFSALLFAFMPIVVNQLKTAYVDIMFCAVFFAVIAIIIQKRLLKLDFLLIGIALSLILAIKPSGAYLILAAGPLLVWALWKHSGKILRGYIAPLLLIAAPMIFGMYWYIKNLFKYESPLYPFGLKLGEINIFPGIDYKTWSIPTANGMPEGYIQRIWHVWTEQGAPSGFIYNYDSNFVGFGPIWFIVLIPAFILSVYLAVKKRNMLFIFVTATILLLFLVYPNNFAPRYSLFIAGLGIMGLSFVLSHVGRLTAFATKGTALVLAVFVVFLTFTLHEFPPGVVWKQLRALPSESSPSRYTSVAGTGKAYDFIEKNIQPDQLIIYGEGTPFIYPLWRQDFANKVSYLPAPEKREWLSRVRSMQVDYVFTSNMGRENNWSAQEFNSVYKDDLYEIFKVR